jgi:hypothetical protein
MLLGEGLEVGGCTGSWSSAGDVKVGGV